MTTDKDREAFEASKRELSSKPGVVPHEIPFMFWQAALAYRDSCYLPVIEQLQDALEYIQPFPEERVVSEALTAAAPYRKGGM